MKTKWIHQRSCAVTVELVGHSSPHDAARVECLFERGVYIFHINATGDPPSLSAFRKKFRAAPKDLGRLTISSRKEAFNLPERRHGRVGSEKTGAQEPGTGFSGGSTRFSNVRTWISRLRSYVQSSSTRLNIGAIAASGRGGVDRTLPEAKRQISARPASQITQCYLVFRDGSGGSFMGQPVRFLKGSYQAAGIQQGAHNPLGESGIWANSFDISGELEWIDDPQAGFFTRKVYSLQDAIGINGTINGAHYRFDDILQVGRNLVVYQLTNLDTCAYATFGFPREVFDARHALVQYLDMAGKRKLQYTDQVVITLCDRVLQAYPQDEMALFNKGVALATKKDFAAAHECFDNLLNASGDDHLCLMYDAHALSEMGAHSDAAERLVKAASSDGDEIQNFLEKFPSLRSGLASSVAAVIADDPLRADVGSLWLRYFYDGAAPSGTLSGRSRGVRQAN